MPRIDVDISQHQQHGDELQDRVGFAEEAGFGAAWVFDHFKVLYGPPDGPCSEAWTLGRPRIEEFAGQVLPGLQG